MDIARATTHHDPWGRLHSQLRAALPVLSTPFSGLSVICSATTCQASLDVLAAAGAHVLRLLAQSAGSERLGAARRSVIEWAFQTGVPFVMYCDLDRALHWVVTCPEELAAVAAQIPEHDFTVLGRTPRAFDSHPRLRRDTEGIVNGLYARIGGNRWDMTAGARGLPCRATDVFFAACDEDSLGADVAWPLHIQQRTPHSPWYIETEGLEFWTADRTVPRWRRRGVSARGWRRWMAIQGVGHSACT
jgi:hypothetical protein